jgi:hypothetical protein
LYPNRAILADFFGYFFDEFPGFPIGGLREEGVRQLFTLNRPDCPNRFVKF